MLFESVCVLGIKNKYWRKLRYKKKILKIVLEKPDFLMALFLRFIYFIQNNIFNISNN